MRKTVKLAYGNDLRRLSIAEQATFDELYEEIKEVVQSPAPRLILKYQDEEGDMITITTDKELQEAFSQSSGKALRLAISDLEKKEPYRKLKELVFKLLLPAVQEAKRSLVQVEGAVVTLEAAPAVAEPVSTEDESGENEVEEESCEPVEETQEIYEEGIYHQAYCNNCGNDIYNIRYKCANCDDFDLCEECELAWSSDLSIHDATHVFLKIYRPISTSYTQAFIDNLYEPKDEEEEEEEEEKEETEVEGEKNDETEDDTDDETEGTEETEDSEDESEETDSGSSSEDDSSSDDDSEESSSSSDSEEQSSENEIELPVIEGQSDDTKACTPLDLDLKDLETIDQIIETLEKETANVVQEENLVEETTAPLPEEPVEEPTPSQPEEKKGVSFLFRAFQRLINGGEDKPSRAELLQFLEAMGFRDKERNEELLEKNDDDVDAVLDQLLA